MPDLLQLCLIRRPASVQPPSPGGQAPIPLAHVQCLSRSPVARKVVEKKSNRDWAVTHRGGACGFLGAKGKNPVLLFASLLLFLFPGSVVASGPMGTSPFWLWLASARLLQVWPYGSPKVQTGCRARCRWRRIMGNKDPLPQFSLPRPHPPLSLSPCL